MFTIIGGQFWCLFLAACHVLVTYLFSVELLLNFCYLFGKIKCFFFFFFFFFFFRCGLADRCWFIFYVISTLQRSCRTHGYRQGRRHNFKSGGVQILLRAKRAEKFWGLYPHICHSGGYNSYEERHVESLSDSVATISYWSCSCNFSQYLNTFLPPDALVGYKARYCSWMSSIRRSVTLVDQDHIGLGWKSWKL